MCEREDARDSMMTDAIRAFETDAVVGAHKAGTGVDAVFAHAAVGLAEVDIAGHFTRANPSLKRILGYGEGELAGRSIYEVMHADDLDECRELTKELLDGRIDSYRSEKRYRRKDGTQVWVCATVSLLTDAAGRPTGTVRVIEDITDRKYFEQSVERLSREYEIILNTAGWGILGTDCAGSISFVNPSAARMLGWNVEELLRRPLREIHHSAPNGTPYGEDECLIYCALHDGHSRQVSGNVLWRQDNTSFPVELTITPIVDEGMVQGVVLAFMDITEQLGVKRELHERIHELTLLNQRLEAMQTQLLQSEKMAAIGQLAAGVAHEINNPIGFVNSNLNTMEQYICDLLKVADSYATAEKAGGATAMAERFDEVHQLKESLDFNFLKQDVGELIAESKDGIARVKKIVLDLKDFSRVDSSDEWLFFDLHNGLDSTFNIIRNEIKYKADVVKEYGSLPEVECLPSQLNQVFMNLLVNAAHAIEKHGTITIRTGRQGDEVWVDVSDTGKGVAPEHIKKIFDPFFTTKPIGQGTGLGLSVSYGIIQKHHGRIEVRSELDKGTTFRVWLPVSQPRGEQA